jgi:hypothetical protein
MKIEDKKQAFSFKGNDQICLVRLDMLTVGCKNAEFFDEQDHRPVKITQQVVT